MESKDEKRMMIMEKIKDNGGFWSYSGIPEHVDDDSVIEASLVHLDLEDIPMLYGIWSKAHIKKVWKERLVSQGNRMNIRNYILAVKFFTIKDPDNYLSRYSKQGYTSPLSDEASEITRSCVKQAIEGKNK